jgi:hypothetical protein
VVHVSALSSRVGLGRGSASGPGAGMARATDRKRGRNLKSCMVESLFGWGIGGENGCSVYRRGIKVVSVLFCLDGTTPLYSISQRSGEMGKWEVRICNLYRVGSSYSSTFFSILLVGASLALRLEEGPTFTVF